MWLAFGAAGLDGSRSSAPQLGLSGALGRCCGFEAVRNGLVAVIPITPALFLLAALLLTPALLDERTGRRQLGHRLGSAWTPKRG